MVTRTRARRDEDKCARRDAILAAARECLRDRRSDEITMVEIAQRCGLAKGTLYLYFPTKEELFLRVLEPELADWLDAMGGALDERGPIEPETFARLIVRTLCPRESLINLLTLGHTVDEPSIGQGELRFPKMLRDRQSALGAMLERSLSLGTGDGTRLLTRTIALVVGLRLVPRSADPSTREPTLARSPSFDFDEELLGAVTALVGGMVGVEERRRRQLVAPSDDSRSNEASYRVDGVAYEYVRS